MAERWVRSAHGDRRHDRRAAQALATRLLAEVCGELGVDVVSVEYGERDREVPVPWIAYVVDPAADNREAPLTERFGPGPLPPRRQDERRAGPGLLADVPEVVGVAGLLACTEVPHVAGDEEAEQDASARDHVENEDEQRPARKHVQRRSGDGRGR
jgi:hypothetical protein